MTRRGHVPSPPDRDPATGMNLDDPVDCLTNLPGLLGHYPVESLILVAHPQRGFGRVVRAVGVAFQGSSGHGCLG